MEAEPEIAEVFLSPHSDEVHEIINRPPQWLVRWGITMFFILFILFAFGTWLIRYPDVIVVPFTLTDADAPRTVVVRSDGKLAKILVKDGENVTEGQPLAYSESTGDPVQILRLASSVRKIEQAVRNGNWEFVRAFEVQSFPMLGEVQSDFQTFNQQLAEVQAFLQGGFFIQKRKLLLEDQSDLESMEKILRDQLELQSRDYELAADEYGVQEKLYHGKVISPVEYKREKAKLIAREMPVKSLNASLLQNKTAQISKHKEILELDNIFREKKSAFIQAVNTLESSLETWKQKYIMVSPVSGHISYSAPLQEQQYLTSGQEVMTVEPPGGTYRGLVKIPQTNLGKLEVGQKALIKMEGFPFKEYGLLEGKLSKLSAVAGRDSLYWGYIDLPKKLNTRYGVSLAYRNGMKGEAEILTSDRRLVERFFSMLSRGGK